MLGTLVERDWRVPADRVVLYRSLANDVYRVEPGHFLKVYRHGWRTPGEVAWECDLIMHLARSGIAVAPITCRADGSPVGVWQAPEGARALLLLRAVPGRQPEPPFPPAMHRAHGALIARVHDAGEAFSSPHPRRTQDPAALLDQSLAEVGPLLAPADRAVADRVAAAARAGLLSNPPTRGLCHGDATMDNVLVTGGSDEAPELALIDFDLSGPGLLATDFPYGIPNWDHFLAGYTSVRPVSPADLAAGPWIDAVGLIANLQFHLITKPSWRGEESKTEGWLDQVLDDLRALDQKLG
jgi:Ser/Thr protein kinase RdoA (MazF antagonist)